MLKLGVLLLAFAAAAPAQNWVLAFSDEFDGQELDFMKWSPHDVSGSQTYVPNAIDVHDGFVHIAARNVRGFTSGAMTTYGSFAQMYGRFEIRCRVPAGKGLEPSFRLLPVPKGEIPAIDVLDALGSEPAKALFGNHWGDEKTERSFTGSYNVGDLSNGFHTVAVEWDKDKIVWFVDGKERFRSVDGVPHQPMYLALRLAVGGPVAKYPDETTKFPALFAIDYIRVFQRP